MNKMGLGDFDPSNYKSGFDSADEIVDRFKQDKPDDWRQRLKRSHLKHMKMNKEFEEEGMAS